MGVAGSLPSHVVEVRLRLLEAPDPGGRAYFARLHTAAEGAAKYRSWGEKQAVGLWTDDVIAVTVCTATSEADFDAHRSDDYAEAYIPWKLVLEEIGHLQELDGSRGVGAESPFDREVNLELALAAGRPPLGDTADFARYASAFRDDREMAKLDRALPRLSVSLRRISAAEMPQSCAPSPVAGTREGFGADASAAASPVSPGAPSGAEALGPDDMKLLLKLQMRNQDLRGRLGIRSNGEIPGIEEQIQAHVMQLGRSAQENQDLKADVQVLERQLAAVAGASGSTAAANGNGGEVASPQLRTVQELDAESVALANECEVRVAALEQELQAARSRAALLEERSGPRGWEERERQRQQRAGELQALEDECNRLWMTLQQEIAKREESERNVLQQLALEHEVQIEEIGSLRDVLERQKKSTEMPPATGILQAEIGELQLQVAQAHRKNADDGEAVQRLVEEIRREKREVEGEQRRVDELRTAAEAELERIRGEVRTGACEDQQRLEAERSERSELLRQKEALVKEISRSQQRMQFFDEKVKQLRDEAEDISERAHLILRSVPATMEDLGTAAAGNAQEHQQLQGVVQDLQQQLQLQKQSEEAFAAEREQARRALEGAKVEAAVLEQRHELLRSRAPQRDSAS